MRALFTAMIAAVEACAIALAGLVAIAVTAVLLWWLAFHLVAEPDSVAQAVSGIWFLGHLAPLEFLLSPEATQSFGLIPEALRVSITLAPLGLTLLTVLLAFRAGWRFADRGGMGFAGVVGGMIGFGFAAWVIQYFGHPSLGVESWVAVLLAALCFTTGSLSGFVGSSALHGQAWWHSCIRSVQERVGAFGDALPDASRDVFRYVAGGLAALLGLGALGFVGALVLGYVEIVTLSQSLQLDPLGVALLFLLNILLLPTACIWSLSWLSGVGFSVGAGTSATPFETLLGPIPALPILGAIPSSWGWAAVLAPLVIVVVGVLLGVGLSRSLLKREVGWMTTILVPIIAAVIVGLVVTGLAALASGSIGPGRLAVNGPDPWLMGCVVAAELGFGMTMGVITRRLDGGRLRERFVKESDRRVPVLDADATAPLLPVGSQTPVDRLDPSALGHRAEPITNATHHTSDRSTTSASSLTNAQAETVPLQPLPLDPPPAQEFADSQTTSRITQESNQLSANADTDEIARAYAWGEDMPEVSHEDNAAPTQGRRNWWFSRRSR